MILVCAVVGALIWIVVATLPWRPWSTKESLDSRPLQSLPVFPNLSVLIPARNEENQIQRCLLSVASQGEGFQIVLVDDQSTDSTVDKALELGLKNLRIVQGKPLPSKWSGKLWALEQGRQQIDTEFILLLDADIELKPGILFELYSKIKRQSLAYVSLMPSLRMQSFWEKLLLPFYIFSFKLLYPFALSNSKNKFFATAAGGCNLVQTKALDKIGGFAAIKDEWIDDCALAKAIKQAGYRSWVGLTHSVTSHRADTSLADIWSLVSRFAYTYLRYSPVYLLLCLFLLFSAYLALPLLGFNSLELPWNYQLVLGAGLVCLFGCYIPTLRFYGLSPFWCLLLPVTGTLYALMTIHSAIQYYLGKRTQWKGRVYDKKLSETKEAKKAA